MSGSPLQISDPYVINILNLDRDFDMLTVMNRSGYPQPQYKSQTWRAQSHLAFPPGQLPETPDSQGVDMARRLVRGGKIYLAGTGGNAPVPDCRW